jgi:hypothetical protein
MSWMILWAEPWVTYNMAATSFTLTRRFFLKDTYSLSNCQRRYDSVALARSSGIPDSRHLEHALRYCNFRRRWISMVFPPSLTKELITERCSSSVHASNFARSADVMIPALRDASNPSWLLAVPTAAYSRISTFLHFSVFNLTRPRNIDCSYCTGIFLTKLYM